MGTKQKKLTQERVNLWNSAPPEDRKVIWQLIKPAADKGNYSPRPFWQEGKIILASSDIQDLQQPNPVLMGESLKFAAESALPQEAPESIKPDDRLTGATEITSPEPLRKRGMTGCFLFCLGSILLVALFDATEGKLLLIFPLLFLLPFGYATASKVFGPQPSKLQVILGSLMVLAGIFVLALIFPSCGPAGGNDFDDLNFPARL